MVSNGKKKKRFGTTREFKIRKNSVVIVEVPVGDGTVASVAIDVPEDLLLSRFRVTATSGCEVKVVHGNR